ncbi:hypothetical protein N6H14_21650 [Paenibacillus sp. CC-CFT747]|nr:hypothetical protein N6H14_21650 [Paenibacillus sp. CC-CFT747]
MTYPIIQKQEEEVWGDCLPGRKISSSLKLPGDSGESFSFRFFSWRDRPKALVFWCSQAYMETSTKEWKRFFVSTPNCRRTISGEG